MNKRIKKILLTIILVLAVYFGILHIKNNNYIFLYINPNNNTSVYPYISKISKEINNILYNAVKQVNSNSFDTKLIYTDAYGSGFLKNNQTSSDLDYSAGLYLGKFEYDGSNSEQIAKTMLRTVNLFQANVISYIKAYNTSFYPQAISESEILGINKDFESEAKIMSESLKKSLTGNPYTIDIKNRVFYMKPGEVVLPDYKYIKLYSNDVSYYENYKKILREITVCMAFYADITDKNTGKTKRIHIVEETFNGRRFQMDFRQFVPHTFTNINSLNFANKIMPSMDNDEYVNLRLNNYFSHFVNSDAIMGESETSPVKVIKRTLQCADILAPILPNEVVDEIHRYSYENLSNPSVILINDYLVANINLINISKSSKMLANLQKKDQISFHISGMESLLTDMINDPSYSYTELKPLFEYHKLLSHNKNNMDNIKLIIKEKSPETQAYIYKLMADKITHKERFAAYTKYFNKVLEQAGIRQAMLYQDIPYHLYVIKNKHTKNIKPLEFNKIIMKNGYYTNLHNKDAKFELIEMRDFRGSSKNIENCWFRYNTSQMENLMWEDMKQQFIQDKKHFHLRINAGLSK